MGEVEQDCIRCRLVCPIDGFGMKRNNTYNKSCENCLIKMRIYQRGNKEAISMLRKTYYKNNKEAFRMYSKQWRMDNAEKCAILTGLIIWKIKIDP